MKRSTRGGRPSRRSTSDRFLRSAARTRCSSRHSCRSRRSAFEAGPASRPTELAPTSQTSCHNAQDVADARIVRPEAGVRRGSRVGAGRGSHPNTGPGPSRHEADREELSARPHAQTTRRRTPLVPLSAPPGDPCKQAKNPAQGAKTDAALGADDSCAALHSSTWDSQRGRPGSPSQHKAGAPALGEAWDSLRRSQHARSAPFRPFPHPLQQPLNPASKPDLTLKRRKQRLRWGRTTAALPATCSSGEDSRGRRQSVRFRTSSPQ